MAAVLIVTSELALTATRNGLKGSDTIVGTVKADTTQGASRAMTP